MSQITCCPSCHTRFKVVPDQLRISDGWVRCGHCKEIFDAGAHLQAAELPSLLPEFALAAPAAVPASEPVPLPAVDLVPEPDPVPEPELEPEPEPEPVGLATTALQQVLAHDDGLSLALELPLRQPSSEPEPEPEPAAATPEGALAFPDIDAALEAELRELLPSRPAAPRRKAAADGPGAALAAQDDGDAPAPDAGPEPGFVRAARRQAFWRRPLVRVLLGLLLLLAGAGLAAQWAWQERNWLAAAQPSLRPWLEQACAHWHCQLAPLQNIAAVAIDSAGFAKSGTRSDLYQLQVALKNQAHLPVAMPALELTLTDAQNQVLLRRVLLPAELGAPAQLAAQGEWSVRTQVQLSGPALGLAGYSVLAFYP